MSNSSTPSIIIRSYQASDLSACKDLILQAHQVYGNPSEYFNYAFQTDMADIEKNYLEIPNAHWWVAVSTDDNRIVGQVAVQPLHLGDPLYYQQAPVDERDQICELRRMSVDPNVQRLGVGVRLLTTLIEFARKHGYRQVRLTTLTSMSQACAFYEKNGFQKGDIYRFTLGDLISENLLSQKEQFEKIFSTIVIYKIGDEIPAEDQERMMLPPTKTNYSYAQSFFFAL